MSGIFGGGQSVNTSAPVIASLRLQTSVRGKPIPLVYGKTRLAGNMLWYGDFTKIEHTTSTGGGKGGGSAPTNTTYTYTAAVVLGLCEGAVNSIPRIWRGKDIFSGDIVAEQQFSVGDEGHLVPSDGVVVINNAKYLVALTGVVAKNRTGGPDNWYRKELDAGTDYTSESGVLTFAPEWRNAQVWVSYTYKIAAVPRDALAQIGLALWPGSYQQQPFGWVQTKHPDEAIAYRGTAYVAGATYDLGDNAELPNHTFELDTQSGYSPSIRDAAPKDVIIDLLTNPHYGATFPVEKIGNLDAFHRYCVANNIFISPAYIEQAPAHEMLDKLMTLTNSTFSPATTWAW